MKMIKAMKKLKFWSKKKKKRLILNTPFIDHSPPPPPRRPPPPPPPCRHYYFPYIPVEPSAPPLPPGMDFATFEEEITHETILLAEEEQNIYFTDPTFEFSGGARNIAHRSQTTSKNDDDYHTTNPVCEVPVTAGPVIRSERDAGGFRCVIDVGFHLFRCFFPCFHIREEFK